jgi:hypothetical protein
VDRLLGPAISCRKAATQIAQLRHRINARQASMPRAEFELTIPVFERTKEDTSFLRLCGHCNRLCNLQFQYHIVSEVLTAVVMTAPARIRPCPIILPRRWRRHVRPKRLLIFNGLRGVISQTIQFFSKIPCLRKLNAGSYHESCPSPTMFQSLF